MDENGIKDIIKKKKKKLSKIYFCPYISMIVLELTILIIHIFMIK